MWYKVKRRGHTTLFRRRRDTILSQAGRHSRKHVNLARRTITKLPRIHRLLWRNAVFNIGKLHIKHILHMNTILVKESTEIHSAIEDNFLDGLGFDECEEAFKWAASSGKGEYVDNDSVRRCRRDRSHADEGKRAFGATKVISFAIQSNNSTAGKQAI